MPPISNARHVCYILLQTEKVHATCAPAYGHIHLLLDPSKAILATFVRFHAILDQHNVVQLDVKSLMLVGHSLQILHADIGFVYDTAISVVPHRVAWYSLTVGLPSMLSMDPSNESDKNSTSSDAILVCVEWKRQSLCVFIPIFLIHIRYIQFSVQESMFVPYVPQLRWLGLYMP